MIAETANPRTARAKVLLAALALGLGASALADRAEAYEKGVCKHELSIHYGPDGRFHRMVFLEHWTNNRGQHIHKMQHSTKRYGKYHLDWPRTFWCNKYDNA